MCTHAWTNNRFISSGLPVLAKFNLCQVEKAVHLYAGMSRVTSGRPSVRPLSNPVGVISGREGIVAQVGCESEPEEFMCEVCAVDDEDGNLVVGLLLGRELERGDCGLVRQQNALSKFIGRLVTAGAADQYSPFAKPYQVRGTFPIHQARTPDVHLKSV